MNSIYEDILDQAKWELAEIIWQRGITHINANVMKGCLGKAYRNKIGGQAGYNEFAQMYHKLKRTPISQLTARAAFYN